MVRTRGVAQAKQHRDPQDDQEGGAAAEMCDAFVEPEHQRFPPVSADCGHPDVRRDEAARNYTRDALMQPARSCDSMNY